MKTSFKISVLIFFIFQNILIAQDKTVIANVNVISPDQGSIQPNNFVIIENDMITYVGRKRPKISSKSHNIINGKGKYLIPGLIDSHVHLASLAGIKKRKGHPGLVKEYFEQIGKSFLYFGYTSVIDLNNYAPNVVAHISKQQYHPDIYTCGEQLTLANGFMMSQEPEDSRLHDYDNFLYDHHNPLTLPDDIKAADHTAQKTVKNIVDDHAICVKVLYENGFGGTEKVTWEMPSLQIMKEVVLESKKYNIPVLMHASSFEAQTFAYNSDVDVIAHGMFHWGDLKKYIYVNKIPQTHYDLMKKIAEKKMGYQPTFRVIAGQRDLFSEFQNDPELENVLPKNLISWLKTDDGQWQKKFLKDLFVEFMGEKSDNEIESDFQHIVNKIAISSKVLSDHDGHFLFGSDTPAMNAYTNPPGYNGYLEMLEWAKAGIPLKELLKAATINNAKEFHLDHLYGSVEKGKKASLLLLDRNPLEDIKAYNSIEKIILNGKVIDRKEMSAAVE